MTVARPRSGQISNKDMRAIVNVAVDAGWVFEMTRGGHGRLLAPDGVTTVVFPGTSSRSRAVRHLRGELRRAGLVLR